MDRGLTFRFGWRPLRLAQWHGYVLLLVILSGQNPLSAQTVDNLARSPILGILQDSEVNVQVKGRSPGNIRIAFRPTNGGPDMYSDWKRLSFASDLTAHFVLREIGPDREYEYRVEFPDGSHSEWFVFTTFPQQAQPGRFSFAFSACLRDRHVPHTVFDSILAESPMFMALMGDQIYADLDGNINTAPATSVLPALRAKYDRNFDEHFQALSSSTPIVSVWDDHDYGQDNADSTYRYKSEARKVFLETFPASPLEESGGALYYRFQVADVDIFVLDTRWHRSPMEAPDTPSKTMLGESQLSWLLSGLEQSTAPFKFIFSSVSFNDYGGDTSSGRSGFDSWMGYKFERSVILSFIEERQIQGVLVFSGDQHYPSTHILNWQAPLIPTSQTATSIVYSLSEMPSAVFDFSASPLHYTRASGHRVGAGNQNDPFYSFEVFREEWSNRALTSVYGLVEVDTASPTKSVAVRFYELDASNQQLSELYSITVLDDRATEVPVEVAPPPSAFLTTRNYPNPFGIETVIEYTLHTAGQVEAIVYDARGREVVTLHRGFQGVGMHTLHWRGRSEEGHPVANGLYFYRIAWSSTQAGGDSFSVTRPVIRLK